MAYVLSMSRGAVKCTIGLLVFFSAEKSGCPRRQLAIRPDAVPSFKVAPAPAENVSLQAGAETDIMQGKF